MPCASLSVHSPNATNGRLLLTKGPGYTREEALGSYFVSHRARKCIAAYGETSETRWRRPSPSTHNAASLVYPGLYSCRPVNEAASMLAAARYSKSKTQVHSNISRSKTFRLRDEMKISR